MKAKLNSLFFLLMFSLLFGGCTSKKSDFILGADLPLTGTVSYYGLSAKKGIDLALKEFNADPQNKAVNIKMVYEDNQGQAKLAVIAATKLTGINKVPAIIGGGSSIETMASAPIANDNKVVLISPISSASIISDAGPYVFRTCPTDNIQAQDLGKWVLELKYKRIGVIFVNSTWGSSFKNDFVSYYTKQGGQILNIQSTDPGETNFRTQLSLIKQTKPDALVFIVYAKEGGALVRQAKEQKLKQDIFGADPWSQEDFRVGAGSDAEGVKYTTPVQYDGKEFNEFREKFVKEYKEEPDVYASNGFDCFNILAQAYKSGAKTGPQICEYLNKVKDYTGATGITNFDQNGDVVDKHFGRFLIVQGTPKQIKIQ